MNLKRQIILFSCFQQRIAARAFAQTEIADETCAFAFDYISDYTTAVLSKKFDHRIAMLVLAVHLEKLIRCSKKCT